jgi:nucleoside-diphosphate-sugar epimerase
MMSKKKVLITGAAGRIGGNLRRYWGDRYQLRLADIKPVEDLAEHEEFAECDIAEYDQFYQVCQGMEVVVHLAADPSMEAEFYQTLLRLNIIGAYNAFEAARQAGCQRVVFASSVNAVLGYREPVDLKWEVPVYPINVYGATKCWGEALGRVYAHQHKLSCICVRIGWAGFEQEDDWDADKPSMGISARDQARLFACCVEAPTEVGFKIVHGVSRHKKSWLDLEVSRELGYEPEEGTAFPRAR